MLASLFDLLESLYPPLCRLCGTSANDDGFSCGAHGIGHDDPTARCQSCAAPLPPALAELALCAACRRDPPRMRATIVLGGYDDDRLRPWILAFKHGARRDLARPLGLALAQRLGAQPAPPRTARLVVPVPLHPLRRLERGYDQARLLAEEVARASGLPLQRALARVRRTPVQGSAGARAREANVRGAFRARRRGQGLLGVEVVLVDDVVTSGATVGACARELRDAGARSVVALALARAARVHDDVLTGEERTWEPHEVP